MTSKRECIISSKNKDIFLIKEIRYKPCLSLHRLSDTPEDVLVDKRNCIFRVIRDGIMTFDKPDDRSTYFINEWITISELLELRHNRKRTFTKKTPTPFNWCRDLISYSYLNDKEPKKCPSFELYFDHQLLLVNQR